MPGMMHIPNVDVVHYVGAYCYPSFSLSITPTVWKRKIKAYRVRYLSNGAGIQEVKVWHTFGYEWVRCRDIEFIWNYYDGGVA